jgi:hypothetical protein
MMAGRHGNNNKRKSVEEGCQPFFSGYIYSQKDKIKIKISKIKCFLRFSVARIQPKFK